MYYYRHHLPGGKGIPLLMANFRQRLRTPLRYIPHVTFRYTRVWAGSGGGYSRAALVCGGCNLLVMARNPARHFLQAFLLWRGRR